MPIYIFFFTFFLILSITFFLLSTSIFARREGRYIYIFFYIESVG